MKYSFIIYTLLATAICLFSLASTYRISKQQLLLPHLVPCRHTTQFPVMTRHLERQRQVGPFFGYFPNLLSPCNPCQPYYANATCPQCPVTPCPTCPDTQSCTVCPTTCPICPATISCPICPDVPPCPTPETCPAPVVCPVAPSCPICLDAPPCPPPETCPAPTDCPTTTTTTSTTTATPPTCATCPTCAQCTAPPPEVITSCDNGIYSNATAAPSGTILVDISTAGVEFACLYTFVAYPPNTKIKLRCTNISSQARFWVNPITTGLKLGTLGTYYTSVGSYLIMTANNVQVTNKIGMKLECTWAAIP